MTTEKLDGFVARTYIMTMVVGIITVFFAGYILGARNPFRPSLLDTIGNAITEDRTMNKHKLASLQTDLRNGIVAQEDYFMAHSTYAPDAGMLVAEGYLKLSRDNEVFHGTATATGYRMVLINPTITSGDWMCSVGIGSAAPSPRRDGTIECSR